MSRRTHAIAAMVGMVIVASACSASDDAQSGLAVSTAITPTTSAPAETSTSADASDPDGPHTTSPSTTSDRASQSASDSASDSASPETEAPGAGEDEGEGEASPETSDQAPNATCRSLDDFDGDDNETWQVVNDGVMGGRSQGLISITDGVMRFEGTLVTEGGGFSLVRTVVTPAELDGVEFLQIRMRTNGRAFDLIADDSLVGRRRSVSHFAPLPAGADEAWVDIGVALDDLSPRSFGNPVDDEPFRPDLVTTIGFIVLDGIDGEFWLEVDEIELCR